MSPDQLPIRRRLPQRRVRAAATPVGMGHVLDRSSARDEAGLPHVVEFQHVTKTYNAGHAQRLHRHPRRDVRRRGPADKGEFVCVLGPAAAARARSCG